MEALAGDRDLEVFEVARVCRVDEETVRRWIRAGDLEAYNVGSDANPRYRVTPRALEAFRAARAARPRSRDSRTSPRVAQSRARPRGVSRRVAQKSPRGD